MKVVKTNIPQDKSEIIVKQVNEAMDKFIIEKVINHLFYALKNIINTVFYFCSFF